jgi:hypothetical protein
MTETVRACAIGECDEPTGPGGVLCPGHKAELEATLFDRIARPSSGAAPG